MGTFQVQLRKTVDDSYEIEVGRSLMHQLADDLANGLLGGLRRFALITDSRVETLYAQPICRMLQGAGFDGEIFSFPAGEESKTRETKAEIEDRMLAAGFRRDCFVLAVGGGVVSDLAGFLAGTYGRGVPFIIYATTLLSAADASVGGGASLTIQVKYVGTNTSITISTISNESWWTSPDFTVVLPACGYSPYTNGSDQAAGWSSASDTAYGYYWSATARDASYVHYMLFTTSYVSGNDWNLPGFGFSVRLFADK